MFSWIKTCKQKIKLSHWMNNRLGDTKKTRKYLVNKTPHLEICKVGRNESFISRYTVDYFKWYSVNVFSQKRKKNLFFFCFIWLIVLVAIYTTIYHHRLSASFALFRIESGSRRWWVKHGCTAIDHLNQTHALSFLW